MLDGVGIESMGWGWRFIHAWAPRWPVVCLELSCIGQTDSQVETCYLVLFDRAGVDVQVWCWTREKDGEMLQQSFSRRLDVRTCLVREELLRRVVELGC